MANTLDALVAAQEPIKAAFETWLVNGRAEEAETERLHAHAAVCAHRHYVETIPAYRRLAEELDLVDERDPTVVWGELASTDDLFKSYDAAWLDGGNFDAMSEWLSGCYSGPIPAQARAAGTIESWIAALGTGGTRVRFSSGTSGHMSFVARDARTDDVFLGHSVKQVMSSIAHSERPLSEYDGLLLAFRGGNQGFAALAEKLGQITRSAEYLFDQPIDADLLRANIRGTATPGQEDALAAFRRDTTDRADEHLERIIVRLRDSAAAGRPVLLYAPPFQLVDLLERIDEPLELDPASLLMVGGGWKSFANMRIPRAELLERAESTLGLRAKYTVEGYGMSECNVLSNRCQHDRFHIPPVLKPIIYDEALLPMPALGRGRYGFSDPFASCYPGFVISGDEVELTREDCACGREGWSIVGEISRAAGHEVKGCGGVMASVRM